MRGLGQDLKLALRLLLKSPAYTVVAVLTLGLAIGATTAIYSVVNGVLLRPLPYKDADRLVSIWETHPSFERMSVSYLDYLDWKARSRAFSDMGCFRSESFNLTGGERAERLRGLMFTASLLPTLGIQPALGRNFTPEEDKQGGPPVAMISHGLWQRRFAGDPSVLGKTLPLSGTTFTVVGVLPREFLFDPRVEVIVPIDRISGPMRSRGNHPGIAAVGRLAPGVTLDAARAELEGIGRQLVNDNGEPSKVLPAMTSLRDDLVENVSGTLWVLLGAVIFVLLVAIANVASLALARGAARRKEMSVRAALGAGKGRLLRQMLVESSVVALAGGALGVLLAVWGVDLLAGMRPGSIPTEAVIAIDRGVLLFSLAISLGAGLLFGILPAIGAARATDLGASLKDGDPRSGTSAARTRARSALIVAEVALALVLLAGAGLSLKTFVSLSSMDTGFNSDGMVNFQVQLPPERGEDTVALRAFIDEIGARMRAQPGVAAATIANGLPIFGSSETGYSIVGAPPLAPGEQPMAVYTQADEGYFDVLGLRLLSGRWLTDGDHEKAPPVVVIDEHLARTRFPGEDPIGKQLNVFPKDASSPATIVGVVGHVVHYGPGEIEAASDQLYLHWKQTPDKFLYSGMRYLGITLRAAGAVPADTLVNAARDQIATLDANLPIFNVKTMAQALTESLGGRRFAMLLLAAFAGVALLLAVVGLYSVMSYLVAQRTREIGVRMALGARPRDVERLVVLHGVKLVAAGIVLGVAGALLLRKLVASIMAGVEPTDPLTLGAVAALLALTALLASWLPARRAARVDPMVALRSE